MTTRINSAERRGAGLISPPARLLYAIILVELLGSVSLALAFGFRTISITDFLPQLYCCLLVASGPLARRINHPRLAGTCETVGLLYGQGFALVALLYPATVLAGPFADAQLAAADRSLGFDWPALAGYLQDRATVLAAMKAVYYSFGWQGAVILPALFITHRPRRAWTMILAANLSLLLTLFIYPFVPAQGTFIHYGITPDAFPNMSAKIAWSFGPAIHAIRDGGARLITRELMVPFVSFPSYHAVAALLLAWACWPIKYLRWLAIILNAAMAVSALIIGAHYLVDLLGGAAVGAFGLLIATNVMNALAAPDVRRASGLLPT